MVKLPNRAAAGFFPMRPAHRRSLASRTVAALLAATVLTLAGTQPAQAWEEKGHQLINGAACDALPASSGSLRTFFATHRAFLAAHSVDADKDKSKDRERTKNKEPLEGPRHYLDMDAYGKPFAFADLPDDYQSAVARFGKDKVDGWGTAPWRIEQLYDALVAALKEKNGEKILTTATWLGHYVADVHVPFHAAVDYDGRAVGQKGIHSHFEGAVPDRFIKAGDLRVAQAVAIRRAPRTLALAWTRESFSDLDAILEADAQAGGKGSADGKVASKTRDLDAFAKTARPIALQRLERASGHLADLWYSAYLAAGKPDLSSVTVAPGFGDKVTAQPVVAPLGTGAAPLPVSPAPPAVVTPAPTVPVAAPAAPITGAFIGNVRSKIFHTPACKGLPSEKNRVAFATREDAVKAGHKPCPECKP